jgi:general secretion pathway protein K
MAYYMMSRLERDTRRTSLLIRTTQAELYAVGSIDWAIEQLRNNLVKRKPDILVDRIPIQSPVNQENGYTISSKITDMQARINLNNLSTAEAQADFKHLMQMVDPAVDEQRANKIIAALSDWIRPGQQQNEYNQYYQHLSPPYRAAHRAMVSASELQLVKGMTPDLFARLQPYITALPAGTKVNALTAPSAVIAALSENMSLATGAAIEKVRASAKVPTLKAFLALDIVKNHRIPEAKFTDVSQYFLLETRVVIEKQHVVIYTLLERTGNESKNAVNVVWQSKGIV